MCTFKTLYLANNGYVIHCKNCNNYQIAAGTLAVTITCAKFVCLKQLAEKACCYLDKMQPADVKSFAIAPPFASIGFLFTANELLALAICFSQRKTKLQCWN